MDLTILLPVYNEAESIHEIYEGLIRVLVPTGYDFEILFIDDGSTDGTLSVLKRLHEKDQRIKVLSFSRNFGHQTALSCGYDHAKGDAVITMDSDLQDEPEYLLKFIEKWKEGYECVYAVREKRDESKIRTFFFKSFYRVFNALSQVQIPLNGGDFCLMDRKVVDAIRKFPERHRFIRGLRSWVGFRQIGIPQHRPRRQDQSQIKHGLKKLFRIGFDGIFAFSYVPMRLATLVGLSSTFLGIFLGLKILYEKFFTTKPIVGWSSLMVTVIFFSGVIIIFLGVIGEYICRIYDETKARPLYFLKEKVGDFDA